jgi:hypothetical protein
VRGSGQPQLSAVAWFALLVQIPSTYTQGRELPINQFTELLRQECAMAGFTEVLTWWVGCWGVLGGMV